MINILWNPWSQSQETTTIKWYFVKIPINIDFRPPKSNMAPETWCLKDDPFQLGKSQWRTVKLPGSKSPKKPKWGYSIAIPKHSMYGIFNKYIYLLIYHKQIHHVMDRQIYAIHGPPPSPPQPHHRPLESTPQPFRIRWFLGIARLHVTPKAENRTRSGRFSVLKDGGRKQWYEVGPYQMQMQSSHLQMAL